MLALLTVEKGSTAKVMIGLVDPHEPHEIMYTREHVAELLKNVDTDYYGRYDFNDLQKMILEDRRLRMNYWTSIITHKIETYPAKKMEIHSPTVLLKL